MRILTYPAFQLEYTPAPIDPEDEANDARFDLCAELANSMGEWLSTMHGKAYGLAATQLGIDLPVAVVFDDNQEVVKLISPKVVSTEGPLVKGVESCFSLPGIWCNVKRSDEVLVEALNTLGETIQIAARGLYARILLHEIDHLSGTLIIDQVGIFEKKFILDKYKKKMKQFNRKIK